MRKLLFVKIGGGGHYRKESIHACRTFGRHRDYRRFNRNVATSSTSGT
jgi:hypothetical protein